jgi:hypothetical protein
VDFVDVLDPGSFAAATMEAVQPMFVNTLSIYLAPSPADAVMTAIQPLFYSTILDTLFVFDPRSRAL